jgi:hypothetical protein
MWPSEAQECVGNGTLAASNPQVVGLSPTGTIRLTSRFIR